MPLCLYIMPFLGKMEKWRKGNKAIHLLPMVQIVFFIYMFSRQSNAVLVAFENDRLPFATFVRQISNLPFFLPFAFMLVFVPLHLRIVLARYSKKVGV